MGQQAWLREVPVIVRSHRERMQMTTGELALELGVDPKLVVRWEAGEELPDLPNYFAMAELFGWPIPRSFVRKGLAGT